MCIRDSQSIASGQSLNVNLEYDEPPLSIEGGKSAQSNQVLFSGTVKGITNRIIITAGNNNLVKFCLFCSNIFCVKIVNPIEPKIIIPTEANNSSLTNAELT